MNYRHEWKHEINVSDSIALCQRLGAAARTDVHAPAGAYRVRSLYFDNLSDKALREKLDGVDRREKFRLRYYNDDISFIRLEKKCKRNGLCMKVTEPVPAAEVRAVLAGDYSGMADGRRPLAAELYAKIMGQGLMPRTIVEYDRKAFTYEPGNVRVTLDYHIRTGLSSTDFLNPASVTVPARNAPIILEIKWDEFLPDIIRDAAGLRSRQAFAFSKYAACRVYD